MLKGIQVSLERRTSLSLLGRLLKMQQLKEEQLELEKMLQQSCNDFLVSWLDNEK